MRASLLIKASVLISASFALASYAQVYHYTEGEGQLELEISEESGDPLVKIFTVNPNTGHTCEFESQGCNLTDQGLTCYTEDGAPVQIEYGPDDSLKVTEFPSELCGLNGNALGVYALGEADASEAAPATNATIYTYTEGEGRLELEVSEETGDPFIQIFTVNPNNGHTCEFESQGCNLTDTGITCYSEAGAPVQIEYGPDDSLKVTEFPSELCGLNGNALGVYALGEADASEAAPATNATIYTYTEGEGQLELEISEESGDPFITIFTVNPNNGHTCEFESQGCNLTDNGITCYTEDGSPVQIDYGPNNSLKVTEFPSELCGMNGNALGLYQLKP